MRSYYLKNTIFLITILTSLPSTVIASDIEGEISEKKIYNFCINEFKEFSKKNKFEYVFIKSKIKNICKCVRTYDVSLGNINFPDWRNRCVTYSGRRISRDKRLSLMEDYRDLSISFFKDSVHQVNLKGGYGRYLNMIIAKEKFIPAKAAYVQKGTPGYYVPGKPGETVCTTAGGAEYYYQITGVYPDRVTTCKQTPGTQGYYVAGTPDRYIPAVPAKTLINKSELTIDCQDKTFDIKGDMRGWKKTSVKGYEHVAYLDSIHCPFIRQIKKQ